MIRILSADGMETAAITKLQQAGFEVVDQHFEADALASALADYDAVVVRSATKLHADVLDKAAAAGRLKLIIRAGVGVDSIDVAYAEGKGITVRNTPAASSASVAELTLGHMFALARFISASNVTMRRGAWNKKKYQGVELCGKTLGLIGMGRISRELARRANALGMRVIYTDILGANDALPYEFVSQEEVLRQGDFVSLHIPAAADGKPVIGAAELALMQPSAYLLNVARGGLIDEDALCDALENGRLTGAALDVFTEEPLKNERILAQDNISLTPHIGAATDEAQERIGGELVEIICNFFK